jgi:hypothetical protein
MAPTILIVPVPAAEPVVGAHRARFDPPAAQGVPAHITVLLPFLELEAIGEDGFHRLRELFAAAEPIEFALTRVARFPGVLFLAPEPAAPFVRLTEAVWRAWPDHPPYRGEFGDIVPHLTVAVGDAPFAELERELGPRLPLSAVAHEAWLMSRTDAARWTCRRSFALGPS